MSDYRAGEAEFASPAHNGVASHFLAFVEVRRLLGNVATTTKASAARDA